MPKYLDLFAGAGGLSEGFIRAGYEPIAHVEMDAAACYTLRTRTAYHWLKKGNNLAPYTKYLAGDITRKDFYALVPKEILDSVLNYEISEESLPAIFKDIDSLLGGEKLDLIVGGPPCQAYSIAGRSRSECKMVGDKRNYLYRLYAEFLKKYQPKYFVFENVLGLLSARDEDGSLHFDNMRALFKKCGYATDFRILNASDYGVLQNRKRIILIGFHGEKADFYPQIPVIKDAHKVGELFCDLPSIKAGEGVITPVKTTHYTGKYLFSARIKEYDGEPVTFHQARPNTAQDLEIYRIVVDTWNKSKTRVSYTDLPERLRTHNNTNSFLDRFKVVAGNLPYAQTVVAHISRDGHYFIHPDIKQNRSITPREAARIQTFPDNYFFESVTGRPSRTLAYKQIGNAVPVCLSYHIAHALLARFTGGVTAESVEIVRDENGKPSIKRIRDMQIVNGGQTTASIFNAKNDRKIATDLSQVFVQMKISVIHSADDMDEIVPRISTFANTQNKIQVADFSANDPFHRRIEELSRTIWAPAQGGMKPRNWFYERARGQYADMLTRESTTKRKKEYKETHPFFTKTDLAKYENTWDQLPWQVSEGAQKNFHKFMLRLKERKGFSPDEIYYQNLIAKAILFRQTEKLVQKQQYGGYRANIVTYTLAFLSFKTAQRIDLERIWKEQALTPALEREIIEVSKFVQSLIVNPPGGANVGEWCKKEKCWQSIRDHEYTLSDELQLELLSVARPTIGSQPATGSIDSLTDEELALIDEAAAIPAETWFALSRWAKETRNFQPWQRSLLFSVGTLAGRGQKPSIKQATHAVKAYKSALEKGFIV